MRALNPNRYAQAFGDSALERLKQEILGQELIFRNQVRELHRLYWTQKNLMNELHLIGFNAHSSKEKNAFSEQSRDRKGGNAMEIGFGIGEMIVEKGLRAPGSFRCSEVIYLENSMGVECNEANEVLCDSFSTLVQKGLFRSEPIVPLERASSSMAGNNMYCLPSIVPFGEGQDRRLQEQKPHVSCIGSVCDLSTNKQGSRLEIIDLNIPLEDGCYHDHNHHLVKIASPPINSSIVHRKLLELEPAKSCPDKSSFASKPDSANPASKTSCEKRAEWLFILNQGKENSDFSPGKLQCKELSDNKRQDSNITYSNSVNHSQTVSRDKLSNHEESEEDTLSSHSTAQDDNKPDELNKKKSAEYNSNVISGNSECSSYEKSAKEPAALSITDNSTITESHSSKHELSYIGNWKLKGRDVAIAAAAEALMNISFGGSAIAAEQLDETVEVQCDEPQHSSDSFEFMAMHLSEIKNEDHIVMPETSSLNETQKDENQIRLQRGRRLRDFRKEILPGLVSLSRHEICEDLYSIGYKLRKNTPKTAGGNWFGPVRNRRSRLYLGCGRL